MTEILYFSELFGVLAKIFGLSRYLPWKIEFEADKVTFIESTGDLNGG